LLAHQLTPNREMFFFADTEKLLLVEIKFVVEISTVLAAGIHA
jgi:hypothetical protein